MRVPWIARRSNQSILKETSPGCIGRTDAKAETPIFGHLMRTVGSLEKILILGGIGGLEEKGTTEDEMASPT